MKMGKYSIWNSVNYKQKNPELLFDMHPES